MKQLENHPVHRKIMQRRDGFVDNNDPEEARPRPQGLAAARDR